MGKTSLFNRNRNYFHIKISSISLLIKITTYNVVYEVNFRLLNSLLSCPLDAYLECEMKLPSPTRMTSFFVSSIFVFFFCHKEDFYSSGVWVTKTTITIRAITLTFSLSYIFCQALCVLIAKTGCKKAITLACYRRF